MATEALTTFPIQDTPTQFEFNSIKRKLTIPPGVVVEYYGNHNTVPMGWLSMNSILTLIKGNYQNLYLAMLGGTNIASENTDVFTIATKSGFIIKV
jgi:hypothetical protein